ncbi:SHOCT domain-containing protein [Leptolyngbya sp. PCC 6406]|uniref:SHOCT domain-containing protein n=1 Tax=Leptolyngbya sp. PCC 6406 TaxID=1173264 RepID=UPI0002ACF375|nr:SHOCT domain-containing protein [Leptolyngbya sp. PCC 6406]
MAPLLDTPPQNPPRKVVAATLALAGALNPSPVPLAGLHKFYLGQPLWGVLYLSLGWTQIPRMACALEAIWYLMAIPMGSGLPQFWRSQSPATGTAIAQQTQAIAAAIRDLEQLRQEGLITEQEFEQQRRHLLELAESGTS